MTERGMRSDWRLLLCRAACALLTLALVCNAGGRDDPAPSIVERLHALDGRSAMAYFLLAEEVAEEDASEPRRTLARTLFVLAHEVDRASGAPEGLSNSVYLALASIADREGEREWLLALAGRARMLRSGSPADADVAAEGLRLAEAIGFARAGEGREVKARLEKDAARPALERLARTSPAVRRMLDDAMREVSCPVCRNRGTVKSLVPRATGGNEEVHTLCPDCRGNPGPGLSRDRFAATLAVECALLDARHDQWSAQTWLDRGAPLRDPDPDDLASFYAVDPLARAWRGTDLSAGRWVRQ